MPELNLKVAEFQAFKMAFEVGASGAPLPADVVDQVRRRISLAEVFAFAPRDEAYTVVLTLDAEEMECARMCFEVGSDSADELPDEQWTAINQAFAAASPAASTLSR